MVKLYSCFGDLTVMLYGNHGSIQFISIVRWPNNIPGIAGQIIKGSGDLGLMDDPGYGLAVVRFFDKFDNKSISEIESILKGTSINRVFEEFKS